MLHRLVVQSHRANILLFAVASIAMASSALGQSGPATAPQPATAAKPIAYETVSIHENKSGRGSSGRSTPDGNYNTNEWLSYFIAAAYGVHPDLVSGLPGWAQEARYDIALKVAPEDIPVYRKLRGRQVEQMDQAVLADRFKLQAHIVPKEFPVYELVVAKGGPKLHEAKDGNTYADGIKSPDGTPLGASGSMMGRDFFTGQQVSVGQLVNTLRGASGRRVVDKTGLTGKYDISLHWTPSQMTGADEPPPSDAGPSIFSALEEQLGLKLQPAKGTEDTLVVDHIEKPSEN